MRPGEGASLPGAALSRSPYALDVTAARGSKAPNAHTTDRQTRNNDDFPGYRSRSIYLGTCWYDDHLPEAHFGQLSDGRG